jgi:uncharacterized protein YacL (UPF0231 family)
MSDLDFYDLDSINDDYELKDDLPSKYQNLKSNEDDIPLNSLEYKKARKRRQNRESAARARARKKITVNQVGEEIKLLEDLSEKLVVENTQLKVENDMLKKELEFYKSMIL